MYYYFKRNTFILISLFTFIVKYCTIIFKIFLNKIIFFFSDIDFCVTVVENIFETGLCKITRLFKAFIIKSFYLYSFSLFTAYFYNICKKKGKFIYICTYIFQQIDTYFLMYQLSTHMYFLKTFVFIYIIISAYS